MTDTTKLTAKQRVALLNHIIQEHGVVVSGREISRHFISIHGAAHQAEVFDTDHEPHHHETDSRWMPR